MKLLLTFSFALALISTTLAHAQEYKLAGLRIVQPYARATVPHQSAGAVYVSIENKGKTADKLIALSSPVADSVEIHTMSMDGDVMKMREVQALEIKTADKFAMKPGDGYHLMLIGLHHPLKAGDRFPLTLTFEKAGKTNVSVEVRGNNGSVQQGH